VLHPSYNVPSWTCLSSLKPDSVLSCRRCFGTVQGSSNPCHYWNILTTYAGIKFPRISTLYWMQPKNQPLKFPTQLELPSKPLPNNLWEKHISYWNNTLDHLRVQSKFSDIIGLEPESHTWNRLLACLPAGQLSFMLRAGTDYLPTPLKSPLLEVQSILYMPLMPLLHTSWMDARRHLTRATVPDVMTRSSTASPPLSMKRSPLQASSLSTCQA